MIGRIFASAVAAGLAAGLASAVLQALVTTPMIVAAEAVEHAGGAHSEAAAAGLQRLALTGVASLVLHTGFALVLAALMVLSRREAGARSGALWGVAGFAAVALAPSFGLPPELPGSAAADLTARQAWWLGTAVLTGAALWLFAFGRGAAAGLAAVALALAPHAVGAPHASGEGTVPADLAARFVTASLAVSLAAWVLLGSVAGAALSRFGRSEPP